MITRMTRSEGRRWFTHLETFDIVLHVSLVQFIDEVFAGLIPVLFKPLLKSIKHDVTQLLNIMLLPCCKGKSLWNSYTTTDINLAFTTVPSKTLSNVSGLHGTLV